VKIATFAKPENVSGKLKKKYNKMNIHDLFTQVRKLVANENTHDLNKLQLTKPEYFNWVEEIFYEMNVKCYPDSQALIWRYNEKEKNLYIPEYL